MNVLIIEDSDLNRRLMHEIVMMGSHTPVDVSTLREAYEKLQQLHIDLVLCDHLLSDGTGFDMAEYLAKSYPSLHMWVVSGVCAHEVKQNYIEKGALFFEKPLDIDHFLDQLKQEATPCRHAS